MTGTIFDFNGSKDAGWSQPDPITEDYLEAIPPQLRRIKLPEWPRASEPELVRHYTQLSQKNFGIDTGFYPLGSCTMKHNPRLNERIVQHPGIDRIHPLQPESQVQGLLAIYYEMQEMLAICSGMDAVTLQPVAGAQGEFTAIRCIQEYHRERERATGTRSLSQIQRMGQIQPQLQCVATRLLKSQVPMTEG